MMIKAGSGSIQTKRRKRRRKEKLWLWEESPLFWASHAFIIFLQTLSHFLSLSLSLSLSLKHNTKLFHTLSISLTHPHTRARTHTNALLKTVLAFKTWAVACSSDRPPSTAKTNLFCDEKMAATVPWPVFPPQTFTSSSYQRRETLTLLRALFRKMAQTGAQQLTGGKVESSGRSLSKLE